MVEALAAGGLWMNDVPADDAAVDPVVHARLRSGERPFNRGGAGFVVSRDADWMIAVCWRAPQGPDEGVRLSQVESYAGVLREAGIRAFVTLTPPEARVVCLVPA